jgi:hypothetical protein
MSLTDHIRSKPKLWASAGLVTAGLAAGGILGTTMSASASTTSTTSNSSSTNATPSGGSPPGPPGAGAAGRTYQGLADRGTVTAVGSARVTIDGKVYAVTSNSDIDKNGEATLSDLAVGDTVTFSTVSSATTPTIDKLHAGSEALDRPTGPPSGAPSGSSGTAPTGGAPNGPPAGPGSSSSGSSSSSAAA